jgi:hypothetical protein
MVRKPYYSDDLVNAIRGITEPDPEPKG